jgi:hypothetical protein
VVRIVASSGIDRWRRVVWLPARGISGNGHMLMIEDNSDELAAMIMNWLDSKGH